MNPNKPVNLHSPKPVKTPFEHLVEQFNNLSDQLDELDLGLDDRVSKVENFQADVEVALKEIGKSFQTLNEGLNSVAARLKALEDWKNR